MAITKIHHINFIVKDLNEAINRYQQLFGLGEFIVDELPNRGVKTARVALGEQWLVLVQPVSSTGLPAEHLAEHGEGFFLISYAVDELHKAAQRIVEAGAEMASETPRAGLENWQVWDVESRDTFGAQIQLCEEASPP